MLHLRQPPYAPTPGLSWRKINHHHHQHIIISRDLILIFAKLYQLNLFIYFSYWLLTSWSFLINIIENCISPISYLLELDFMHIPLVTVPSLFQKISPSQGMDCRVDEGTFSALTAIQSFMMWWQDIRPAKRSRLGTLVVNVSFSLPHYDIV